MLAARVSKLSPLVVPAEIEGDLYRDTVYTDSKQWDKLASKSQWAFLPPPTRPGYYSQAWSKPPQQ